MVSYLRKMEALLQQINTYKEEIGNFAVTDPESVENFRIKYLGTKGIVKQVMGEMKHVPNERKKEFGQLLNEFKQFTEEKYEALKSGISGNGEEAAPVELDLTLPGDTFFEGSRHPITLVRNKIVSIFERIGFAVAEG